jgi:hypothetical protein
VFNCAALLGALAGGIALTIAPRKTASRKGAKKKVRKAGRSRIRDVEVGKRRKGISFALFAPLREAFFP